MMPIKEILELKHLEPKPPVLVIDETTIKCTVDAGPVCGCDEKFHLIKNYKPFIPGVVNPYKKKETSDVDQLQVHWKRLKLGTYDLQFEKPVAVQTDKFSPSEDTEEIFMFVRQPKYTEGYLNEKLRQCKREHGDGCKCKGK